jgi:pyruvate/2-oxoglutarate/acetoin dehydrogenase E1 component
MTATRPSSTWTFPEAVRAAMAQALSEDASVFAYGEGINDPNGFFGTTADLAEVFGEQRCFDVPNSEETLAGFGLGAALVGMRPIFVNLRVEFLLLAMSQIVNHVAKWGAMAGRSTPVPFTIRAMVGRGWGQGAQHSGSYAAMFAHVPGLHVAVPSGPNEAAGLLLASVRGDHPTVLIEPKAVYETEAPVLETVSPLPLGTAIVRREGKDFTLVALGDTVGLALDVAESLSSSGAASVEVVDLCSLAPLDEQMLRESVAKTTRLGVLDLGWESYGVVAEVTRCLLTGTGSPLRPPVLSWAPRGHAPAGCFREAHHYPTADDVAQGIVAALSTAAPPE